MSARPGLERESFQKLLASAYAVQESQMDPVSLSTMVEIDRAIRSRDLAAGEVLPLIAEQTLSVTGACGVAIALLERDHLVYRATSGGMGAYLGRQMVAVLGVPVDNSSQREVLRVENAQSDPRIEAEVARQFGAEALLILPFYRDRKLAGVLQIHYTKAHVFVDRELRFSRFITRLIGDLISQVPLRQDKAVALPTPAGDFDSEPVRQEIPSSNREDHSSLFEAATQPSNSRLWTAVIAITTELLLLWRRAQAAVEPRTSRLWSASKRIAAKLPPLWQVTRDAATIRRKELRPRVWLKRWGMNLIGMAVALMIAFWIAQGDRRPPVATTGQKSQPVEERSRAKPASASNPIEATPVVSKAGETEHASRSAFRRIRVSKNEIDEVSEDVTVRHFTPAPAAPRAHRTSEKIEYGSDVTVWRFGTKRALESHSLRDSDNGAPLKLVR